MSCSYGIENKSYQCSILNINVTNKFIKENILIVSIQEHSDVRIVIAG